MPTGCYAVPIAVALAAVLCAFLLFFARRHRSRPRSVIFTGPRGTGKTTALLRLTGSTASTVATLRDHKLKVGDVEITERLPKDTEDDFFRRFSLSPSEKTIFFVKNEEEMHFFPDLHGYDIRFVMWPVSTQKLNGDVIYLDEDASQLLPLLR